MGRGAAGRQARVPVGRGPVGAGRRRGPVGAGRWSGRRAPGRVLTWPGTHVAGHSPGRVLTSRVLLPVAATPVRPLRVDATGERSAWAGRQVASWPPTRGMRTRPGTDGPAHAPSLPGRVAWPRRRIAHVPRLCGQVRSRPRPIPPTWTLDGQVHAPGARGNRRRAKASAGAEASGGGVGPGASIRAGTGIVPGRERAGTSDAPPHRPPRRPPRPY
jgi:hypothetical protein